jgi:hypothetical protein
MNMKINNYAVKHYAMKAALPPGKKPRYPLDRRPDGLQNRSGRREE